MTENQQDRSQGSKHLFLGLPMWGFKAWVGNFYRSDAQPRDYLLQYSSVFNTVEGNTTFYSLPAAESVARWKHQTPKDFRFSFKFPQTITHERQLCNVDRETAQFLRRIAPLEERVGAIMLQFPRALSPAEADVLWRFLPRLPKDFTYAVELRHPDFFRDNLAVAALDEKLKETRCGRVIMDTRAMRSGKASDDYIQEALRRKPDLPVHPGCAGGPPIIRFVGHPDAEVNQPFLHEWVRHLETWTQQGLFPYFFVHCPNNVDAPPLARRFHSLLSAEVDLGELPPWPSESESSAGSQLELF